MNPSYVLQWPNVVCFHGARIYDENLSPFLTDGAGKEEKLFLSLSL